MVRLIASWALALLVATASAAAAPGTQLFEGQFRDAPNCGGGKSCGTGVLTGFGKIKTEIVFGPAMAAPAKGCLGATGTRTLTLANDATSTLRLAVKGAACGSRTWGTFKVVAGAGRFDKAKGSGVILGTLTKAGQESIRYTGVLTLAK
jgi:hypothetical protein